MNRANERDGISLPGSPEETLTTGEVVLTRFAIQLRRGANPRLEDFAAQLPANARTTLLVKLIELDLEDRTCRGESPRIEPYVGRFPEFASKDEMPVELILHEYFLRARCSGAPDLSEYATRFPNQIAALRVQIEKRDATRSVSPSIKPSGNSIGDYEIIRPLGEGASSKVYLARQKSLGRLVALKVAPNVGNEARTLAALEHDNIVLVYSEEVEADQRLLAMRYVPGITLGRLLELLSAHNRRRLRGRQLLELIHRELAAEDDPNNYAKPCSNEFDASFADQRFVRAACRIVWGLARALAHAHQRGVLHRDIKPANILVTRSGRALLMDFNIASHSTDSESMRSPFGGTLAYMAPEHLAAFYPDAKGSSASVDERADIFSLGVVFYELLSGRHPYRVVEGDGDPAQIRQMLADRLQPFSPNPRDVVRISTGLDCILDKCLAPDLGDRYQSAAELAEDLERYLSHQPLRHAPDPSWVERGSKWIRRHPRTLASAATLLVATLCAIGLRGWIEYCRINQVVALADDSTEAFYRDMDFEAGMKPLEEASALLNRGMLVLPHVGFRTRVEEVRAAVARLPLIYVDSQRRTFARGAQFEIAGLTPAKSYRDRFGDPLEQFDVLRREDWYQLPEFLLLVPEYQTVVEEEVTELLVRRILERTRGDAAESQASKETARTLLSRVPPSHKGLHVVARLHERIGDEPPARASNDGASTAFDAYMMGIFDAYEGRAESAVGHFTAAIRLSDEHDPLRRYWAQFQRAVAYEQLGRDDEAIADYQVCIQLDERNYWAHHNLGLLYARLNNLDAALVQLRFASRQSNMVSSNVNLAAVALKLGLLDEAHTAAKDAVNLDESSAEAHANLGAVLAALEQRDAAIAELNKAIELDPNCEAARRNLDLLTSGTSKEASRP